MVITSGHWQWSLAVAKSIGSDRMEWVHGEERIHQKSHASSRLKHDSTLCCSYGFEPRHVGLGQLLPDSAHECQ
ncbi:MAG: hypothetical protein MUF72_14160 [Elainella sp. Prado103]|nr:hypothetical protein [Elainella sp. Prado103]